LAAFHHSVLHLPLRKPYSSENHPHEGRWKSLEYGDLVASHHSVLYLPLRRLQPC
jgi:hypothetical protein